MNLPPLILASALPRRAEWLRRLDLRFQIVARGVGEFAHEHLSRIKLCRLNDHRKAGAVAKKFSNALVIGADTLAAACAETGQCAEAGQAGRRAMELAQSAGQKELSAQIQAR